MLRVGINLGDVMVEGSDLYGDGVNIAARLEALAEPGTVLVSRPSLATSAARWTWVSRICASSDSRTWRSPFAFTGSPAAQRGCGRLPAHPSNPPSPSCRS